MLRWLLILAVLQPSGQLTSARAAEPEAKQPNAATPKQKPLAGADQPKRPGAAKRAANQAARANAQQQQMTPPPASPEEAGVPVLSTGDSYDDFASVAQTPDGTFYAAYAAYYDGHDQIRLHRKLAGGKWSMQTRVPTVEARADVWMPQVAADADGRVWVIWSEQVGRTNKSSGNWDLYARALDGGAWGPLVRITDDPKPDINHSVVVDRDHKIYVVWQAHADNTGDVMLARYDGEKWSKPLAVTRGSESDWYPQAAVDAKGKIWIVFDSYRNGDYDVFLTSVEGDEVGDIVPVATSPYYEAHPSVACTPDGRVWIAWEQAGYNWGKDNGYWIRLENGKDLGSQVPRRQQRSDHPAGGGSGTALGSQRWVRVAAYEDGQVKSPPDLTPILESQLGIGAALPLLATGEDGRLWLRVRRMDRGPQNPRKAFSRYWTEEITWLGEQGWQPTTTLAGSPGRISVFSRILPTKDGGLAVAYSSDQRGPANYHQPIHDRVLVCELPRPKDPSGTPKLGKYQPPADPPGAKSWDVEAERAEVARVRSHRTKIDGRDHRIVRGDMHRHSEMSWDVGPGNDGSYLDFYRYMIDVASMDFGALTDHQGGGHYAYHWWLIQKAADMYYLPPRFVPLFGYERSVVFPDGHRNIMHAYRGVPIFSFQVKPDKIGVFPGVGGNDVLENDTKLLYQYLKGTGGLSIPHTSGTDMGTDWRDNDRVIEPVVEVYQGARNSYEALGAPRTYDASNPPGPPVGGYRPEGMVWNALAKGYRLGMTSSSDHGSTHISYSHIYAPENDRQAILDAMRRRHTFGATDNFIVEVRSGEHFMGDEFTTSELPSLELRARTTGTIARIDLVRNNQYIYTSSPLKNEVSIKYTDREPADGLNYYYFRIQQENGELAWASPIWIVYEKK